MKQLLCFFSVLFCALIGLAGHAQEDETDKIKNMYMQNAMSQAALYSGKLHDAYPRQYIGHPYVITDQYTSGKLWYDGDQYVNILMRVDSYSDELIVLSPDSLFQVVLDPQKVDMASLHNKLLYYHRSDNLKNAIGDGYTFISYQSPLHSVLMRESSRLKESRGEASATVTLQFENDIRYYIKKDDAYYWIKNKGALLNLLKSHKKSLNSFIKQNNLDFKKNPEQTIISVVKEFEKLNNTL